MLSEATFSHSGFDGRDCMVCHYGKRM